MKKRIAMLLAFSLLLPLAACGKTEPPVEPAQTEPAPQPEPEPAPAPAPEPEPEPAPVPEPEPEPIPEPEPEPIPEPEPEPIPVVYAQTDLTLFEKPELFKLLGRAEITDKGLTCDWAASGIEFEVNCRGTVTMDCRIVRNVYYEIYVDGVLQEPRIYLTSSNSSVTLAEDLEPGVHTFRFIQDSDLDAASGASSRFGVIHADCDPATWKATPQKALYFEFVGSSSTSGCGSIGDNSTPWSIDTHSAINSYAYQLCELLDADYSLVSKGGIGAAAKSNGKDLRDIYPLQNGYKSSQEYGFSRKPDLVFFAIGNDSVATAEDERKFADAVKELVAMVREKNGADCKIVLLYGWTSAKSAKGLLTVMNELNGKENGIYVKAMKTGTDGVIANGASTGHPNRKNHTDNAELLADYIKDIL